MKRYLLLAMIGGLFAMSFASAQESVAKGSGLASGKLLLNGQTAELAELEAECPVQGELVHWIADYCMFTLETDDEIAAGDCIAKESAAASTDLCAEKLHYKKALCRAVVMRDGRGTIEQCVADRSFAGSTVTNGGVGAPPTPGTRTGGS